MVDQQYDVIVVGAGPAGIFAALELSEAGPTRILILEKGTPLEERRCPARQEDCIGCRVCSITTGWGGAGAFSDGKLTLTPDVGGWLGEFVGRETLVTLIDHVDDLWVEHGATPDVHEPDPGISAALSDEAAAAGMRLVPMRIRHMGTDHTPEVLASMQRSLVERGVEIRTRTQVERIVADEDRVRGVELTDGSFIAADAVIAAPGREGAEWLAEQADLLGVPLTQNAVDIGVRVEVPANVMKRLTDPLYEAKLIFHTPTFDDEVRTFCMNPYGEVTTESYGDVVTVNGHAYATEKTDNTNFAILVSQSFTHPFREPLTYGHSISRLANLLGESILVQRLGDLQAGRRSNEDRIARCPTRPTLRAATPGDLSFVLPYRHLTGILEFLEALDVLAPGVAGPDTLLYGVEVKFYSSRLKMGPDLQAPIEGLYGIGDGAGVTRGLAQSSASGVVAARAILAKRDA